MENKMEGGKEQIEKKEEGPRLVEGERYDFNSQNYPYVVHYKERPYDLRNISVINGNCLYRMTAEHRMELPEPDYIEVDKEGFVVREWNS